MRQVIVKYNPAIGHDVVLSEPKEWEEFVDFDFIMPDTASIEIDNLKYVSKFSLHSGDIIINLVVKDEQVSKESNRISMKNHAIIVTPEEYEELGGLPAIVTPLLNSTLDSDELRLLDKNEFTSTSPVYELRPYFIAKKILAKKKGRIYGSDYDPIKAIKLAAFLDRLVMGEDNQNFSVHSFVDANHKQLLEKYSFCVVYAAKSLLKLERYILSKATKDKSFNEIIENLGDEEIRKKLLSIGPIEIDDDEDENS